MHLINVHSLQLESFEDEQNLEYAILSHRWREEEVLFQDMQTGTAQNKAGFAKLKRFCEEAAASGCQYAWCDTCCIDKSSSAELSESINSMFQWYQNATLCLAYLYDVTTSDVHHDTSNFAESVWFTRGWCLQELLAPRSLTFYNSDWVVLGTKSELSQPISRITGIHHEALCGSGLEDFSIAQRMSWASDRITTRVEDIAYSLLGIFGINMPLIYGEGKRAYTRLQEELIKQSDDHSIFVHSITGRAKGLLAESPADFRNSSTVIRTDEPLVGEPYSLTNTGLSIELALYPWTLDVYLALLDCRGGLDFDDYVGIFLQLKPQLLQARERRATDRAVRIKFDGQAWISRPKISGLPSIQGPLYLDHRLLSREQMVSKRYAYWIRRFEGENAWAKTGKLWAVAWNQWDSAERKLHMPSGVYATVGIVVWEYEGADKRHNLRIPLRLAFSPTFEPIIEFAGDDRLGGYFLRRELIDLSMKETYLSDMEWIAEQHSGRGNGILLRGSSRNAPMVETIRWGISGAVSVVCQKMQVDGVETWVLDIAWQFGTDGLPQRQLPLRATAHDEAIVCDGCGEGIHGRWYKCTGCVDYDLCSLCIGDAKQLHEPEHEFIRRA